jgi:hypothetical protein
MRIRMQRHRELLEFSPRGGLMESTIVYRVEPRLRMLQSAVYLVPALAVIPMLSSRGATGSFHFSYGEPSLSSPL